VREPDFDATVAENNAAGALNFCCNVIERLIGATLRLVSIPPNIHGECCLIQLDDRLIVARRSKPSQIHLHKCRNVTMASPRRIRGVYKNRPDHLEIRGMRAP
jgi:hypothetical protein